MMMGLSGKIGVGVGDSLAVFAVGVDEKSVSANEDCENHRHQQRYIPYCPSHKEMRYEMRLQKYKRIPSRPNPVPERAGQSRYIGSMGACSRRSTTLSLKLEYGRFKEKYSYSFHTDCKLPENY